MVIRGRTRGNGKQLSEYLLALRDNESIAILDVLGRGRLDDKLFHQTMLSMSLTSELTKSDKGLYHAQINPAYGEDQNMTPETWLQAADVLEKELGLQEQRRVVVLHSKKGRTHAHIVWERYHHDKGTMISDSFSRLAQDRARQEMEKLFEHKQTPVRNAQRPEMKQTLSDLWTKLKSGADFIKAAKMFGYTIAAGIQRRPFMVVDDTGRSFDLIRQLDKVKTKEVRERLKGEKLLAEKDAIELVRKKQKLNQKTKSEPLPGKEKKIAEKDKLAAQFASSKKDIVEDATKSFEQRKAESVTAFKTTKDELLKSQAASLSQNNPASDFAENKNDTLSQDERKKQKRDAFLKNFDKTTDKTKSHNPGREPY